MAFKNAAENLLQEIQQLSGLTTKEMADLRSRIIPITNEGIKEAFETALSEVDLIVDEYSQKRGIGEKF
jgi:DNA mismatch repair protein MutH